MLNKLSHMTSSIIAASLFFMLALPVYAETVDEPPLPTPVGRVVWIKGTFKAVMANKEERTLQKTSIIYEHDELVTDENSQAQIVFTDNTLMTFRAGTKFYINQYEYSPKKKTQSAGKYVMDLIQGGFRTITGLIAKKNPDDYRVNTPVATIGVRGTDYSVYFKDGEIFIGYIQGSPCIQSVTKEKLCLDADTPFATIPQGSTVPIPLSQRPDVFQEQLEIRNVRITPFASASPSDAPTRTPSGPITNFCITQ